MKTFLRSLLLILTISLLASSAALALPKVLVMGAEQTAWVQDVQTKLTNTGQFAQVDFMVIPSGGGSLPSLATLEGYGSVMIFDDNSLGAGTGALLASYVDYGGGVVVCHFCLASNELPIDASFNNSTYQVIVPGNEAGGTQTLGNIAMPSHPIMKNVSSLSGGSSSYHGTSTTLAGSAYTIASWSDGSILVAAREKVGANSKARRVDIDMFPVSSTERSDFWQVSTNGDILMANAMTWAAGGGAPPPELNIVTSPPTNPRVINFGTQPPGAPVTSCVTANSIGLATLHITGISLAGPSDFSLVTTGKKVGDSILVGNSAQYCIQFNPTASGTRTGTFTLTTDGADSGTQTVTLTGNGQVPAVSYSSKTMFQGVGTELTDTSGVQYLYVNSTGVGPLSVTGVSFFGLDASAYFVTHVPAGPIASGGVDSIGVRFFPDIEGIPDAHMVVKSNAGNIPSDTVTMRGVGILPHLATASSLPNVVSNINHTMVVNFDSVMLGTDSCLQVLLTNPGTDTFSDREKFLFERDYDFTLTTLTGASDTLILPGGVQPIKVCFDPLGPGYRTATLRLVTNIPHTKTTPPLDTSQFTVQFIGTGVPVGHLAITGPATNGITPLAMPACVTDTFWNTGASSLWLDTITFTGPNAADFSGTSQKFPILIGANSFWTYQVCAAPHDTGAETAVLTGVASIGEPSTQSATLNLSVYGTKVADTLVISGAFPTPVCGTDTATITVTNTGNVATQYAASVAGGTNPADFSVLPAMSPLESGGGVATFKVAFTPSTAGNETTNFNIAGGGNGTLVLTATGGAATIAGSGTAPTVGVGAPAETFTATINNTGTCPWTPGPASVTSPFAYVGGGTTPIAPNGSTTDTFTFTAPSVAGISTQTVGFTSAVGTSIPAANVVINGTANSAGVATVSAINGYSLDQNYPNPFGGESTVEITLPTGGMVQLNIINVEGQVVESILNRHFDAGTFEVKLNADGLSSGTYYYQMTSGDVILTRQMEVIK